MVNEDDHATSASTMSHVEYGSEEGPQAASLEETGLLIGATRDNLGAAQLVLIPREDSALCLRESIRQEFQELDDLYGRYVVRRGYELTIMDVRALRQGRNDILALAATHLDAGQYTFLKFVFEGWNSAVPPPIDEPIKRALGKNEVSIKVGTFKEDQFTQVERKAAKKAGVHPSQLPNLKPRPAYRRMGADVYLKVTPGRFAPKREYVDASQRIANQEMLDLTPPTPFSEYFKAAFVNYDRADEARCAAYNKAFLVWLARHRIYNAYNHGEAIPWHAQVPNGPIHNEPLFRPSTASHTCLQMFKIQWSDIRQIAGATAVEADITTGDESMDNSDWEDDEEGDEDDEDEGEDDGDEGEDDGDEDEE